MELKEKSYKYEFTSGINARYDEDAEGEVFENYLAYVTNEDEELKRLLQEILVYVLSNYTNIRTAFVFLGIKGTGKSLMLDIIRNLVGSENTSNVNIQEMENEYYAANILEHKINIAPDTPAAPIKGEISKFKSFTSELDVTTGRNPYFPVFNARCRSKFLFGTNHHYSFSGIGRDDLEAFFDRMVYIPFNRPIRDDKRDVLLNIKLANEYDYIFTWAMQGLKRLIDNNFNLSSCNASENLKMCAMAQYCPEQIFFDHCIKTVDNGRFESLKAITDAFEVYCNERNVEGKYNIAEYLKQRNIDKMRKRINAKGYLIKIPILYMSLKVSDCVKV